MIHYLLGLKHSTIKRGKFTELKAHTLLHTIKKLEQRIGERFPESGLYRVSQEFYELSVESEEVARKLSKPLWPIRIAIIVATCLLLGLVGWAIIQAMHHFQLNTDAVHDLVQATESGINELIFLALTLYFLGSLENRLKRRIALKAMHQLRSIAHVIDMHQLTKDPAQLFARLKDTTSSPERKLDRYQLNRYLDYCSELLALTSKIAALFAQNMDDEIVLQGVNDIETLTQGLSVKIWQKIMILDFAESRDE